MSNDAAQDERWTHGQQWTGVFVLGALMALVCASVLLGPAGLIGLLVLAVLVVGASVPDLLSRR